MSQENLELVMREQRAWLVVTVVQGKIPRTETYDNPREALEAAAAVPA
jgi:hypothetical protein